MKLGVYVGSFDPVHKGHICIVKHLLGKYLDKVIMMPTGNYWDKNDLIDLKYRIQMLNLYKSDRILIESENNDLPYTYLVMEYLKGKYKSDELYLIIGADNIVSFDKWKNFRELLEYNMIIIKRDNIDIEYHLDRLNKFSKYLIVNELGNIDISSTKIRDLIKEGKVEDIIKLIDKPVLEYIIDNNLYK